MATFERIKPVVKKEFRQIFRDKRSLGLLLVLPAFLLIMYGYALNFDVKHLSLAVLDQEKSQRSRDFLEGFRHTEYFDLKYDLTNQKQIDDLMEKGNIQIALVIPWDFSRSLIAGRETSVQVIIDGEETGIAGTAIGYVNAIVQSYTTRIVIEALESKGGGELSVPVELRPRVWFNPELKSVRFLIPGLMAFVLMITVVISTAFSVVREIERGSIEQIIVSPLRPHELIIGKIVPYALISLISAHSVLLFGDLLFDVSIKGNYAWLLTGILFFLVCGLGLGLLISTIASTQQVAFMLAVITTMLPTFILSGFIFPIRNMPAVIQAVTYLIPARYFLVILRGVMLKGVGLSAFGGELAILAGFAVLTLILSSLRMSKTLKKG
ncbi:MAG: ABC transporter permease [Candidatus Aminicenantes bacterium]|nr:ABC transporter permease [Candidatus Aminicenantes bacterium]